MRPDPRSRRARERRDRRRRRGRVPRSSRRGCRVRLPLAPRPRAGDPAAPPRCRDHAEPSTRRGVAGASTWPTTATSAWPRSTRSATQPTRGSSPMRRDGPNRGRECGLRSIAGASADAFRRHVGRDRAGHRLAGGPRPLSRARRHRRPGVPDRDGRAGGSRLRRAVRDRRSSSSPSDGRPSAARGAGEDARMPLGLVHFDPDSFPPDAIPCLRCGAETMLAFAGPCPACTQELRAKFEGRGPGGRRRGVRPEDERHAQRGRPERRLKTRIAWAG